MENNEVMVTEVMDTPEYVESNGTGIGGFITGLLLGGGVVAIGKFAKNKISKALADRKAKKEEETTEETKETVEVE